MQRMDTNNQERRSIRRISINTSVTRPTLKREATRKDHALWSGSLDFTFNIIANVVDLGNVWRFPYLCYSYGGGIFLIPYVFALFCIGFPLMLLELSVGQFSGSILKMWTFCPMFSGITNITSCISFLFISYYSVLLAWILFYFFQSFKTSIPWKKCHKEWSTILCRDNLIDIPLRNCTGTVRTFNNGTCYDVASGQFKGIYNRTLATEQGINMVLPAEEYLKYEVLQFAKSAGIHDIGPIQWRIASCFAVINLIFLILQLNGIRVYAKIAYFSIVIPLLTMSVLSIKVLTAKGSWTGIAYYLYPDASHLITGRIWFTAINQVFFSLSLSCNALPYLSSHNRFYHNIVRDAFLVVFIDMFLAFMSGFIVFGMLGTLAVRLKISIRDVVSANSMILFVTLPQELASQQGATLSNMGFFMSLLLLGFNAQMISIDVFITHVKERLGIREEKKKYVSFSIMAIIFLIGLSMTTSGGIYVFTLFDAHVHNWNAIVASLLMIAAVIVYGVGRLCDDIEKMVGSTPVFDIPWKYMRQYFMVTWSAVTPICLTLGMLSLWISFESPTVDNYTLPTWANVLGFSLAGLAVLSFFIDLIPNFFKQKGDTKMRLRNLLRPVPRWARSFTRRKSVGRRKSKNTFIEMDQISLYSTPFSYIERSQKRSSDVSGKNYKDCSPNQTANTDSLTPISTDSSAPRPLRTSVASQQLANSESGASEWQSATSSKTRSQRRESKKSRGSEQGLKKSKYVTKGKKRKKRPSQT